MRGRLLDATIDCLVERGWAGLSTNDVVRRAGASRGALTHHFPSRAGLVAAAAERLVEQRVNEFSERFSRLTPAERTLSSAIEILWGFYRDHTFPALLELTVAARTDPSVRAVLRHGPDRLTTATLHVLKEVLPDIGEQPRAEPAVRACLALLAGLALQAEVDGDAHGHHDAVVREVKGLSTVLVDLLSAPREEHAR